MKKINGLRLANQLLSELDHKIQAFQHLNKLARPMLTPRLGIILIGNNAASLSYIKRKKISAQKAHVKTRLVHLAADQNSSAEKLCQDLQNTIKKMNNDPKYHGIVLQLPLPSVISQKQDAFMDYISPAKDVDCLGRHNKKIYKQCPRQAVLKPCVVEGVMRMLKDRRISLKNKKVLVIGKGKLVGQPLLILLKAECTQVFQADINTPVTQLYSIAKQADIIFSASGKQDLIGQQHLKKGCVIVDIGVSPDPMNPGKVRGDFSQQLKRRVCSFYTPVPKGVGPMGVASLINNVFKAWKLQCQAFKK